MENTSRKLTGISKQPGLFESSSHPPGSMNDAALIRGALVESIRQSGKSRTQIAEAMSYAVGREITERMLNGYTAESKDEYRWPAELTRAFCFATGSDRLLRVLAEAAGLRVASGVEADLLELGRAFLQRKRAEASIVSIEHRLEGVVL